MHNVGLLIYILHTYLITPSALLQLLIVAIFWNSPNQQENNAFVVVTGTGAKKFQIHGVDCVVFLVINSRKGKKAAFLKKGMHDNQVCA